ncbi:DUF1616 domain-containing protein [Natrinema halophilum]|uniref:DUF1616 domain-containing protein n=1 Tax=Natrinema halophilum TaxID=1699371 RepID=A0A7D5L032_9EURY|nr:DUF1616 domain-containing protein [Natrinema halophilum]QLG50760.1 DUF1616 domain-containing protein [Natrinema halophilum]
MSDNQWWFFDQAVIIAATGATTFGLISDIDGVIRVLLAMPLLLFFPGYTLVSALFPDKPDDEYQSFDEEKTGLGNPLLVTGGLESVERVIMSVVFSVALVPAIALLAAITPRGLNAETVLSGLSVLTVFLALLAIGARYQCPPDRRFAPSVSTLLPFFTQSRPNGFNRIDTTPYNVAIIVSLILLAASGGYAVANPPQGDGFTEFSVATENVTNGNDVIYDSSFTAGERRDLQISITNQEHEEQTYTTVVLLQRVQYNDGEVAVQNSTELQRKTSTVADGATHNQTLTVTPNMQGTNLRLLLLLYEGSPSSQPTADDAYRVIRLPIEVN